MTHEEQMKQIKPILDVLDSMPVGVFVPSTWQPPEDFKLEKFNIGNVPVEHLIPQKKNNKVIFHLHGGGYIRPLLDTYRNVAVKYSKMAGGAEVFSLDYRLAPQNEAPAALEDAVLVYKWLLDNNYKSEDILFIGDSAGGNLVLVTTLYLRDNKLPLPKGVIAVSPWADIEDTPESREENRRNDVLIGEIGSSMYYEVMKSRYFQHEEWTDPYVSPVYGDYTGFPSLLIQTGSFEILRDDSLKVAKAAKEAGIDVTQTTYEGQSHDFQLFFPEQEESKAAWVQMKTFVDRIFA